MGKVMPNKKPIRPGRRPSSNGTSSTGPKVSGRFIITERTGKKERMRRRPEEVTGKK